MTRRKKLLRAADAVLAHQGLSAATIQGVTGEGGITREEPNVMAAIPRDRGLNMAALAGEERNPGQEGDSRAPAWSSAG